MNHQGLTTGAKAGIGIGVPIAVIIIGLLAWIGLRLAKRAAADTVQAEEVWPTGR
jgi:hypothetical protein